MSKTIDFQELEKLGFKKSYAEDGPHIAKYGHDVTIMTRRLYKGNKCTVVLKWDSLGRKVQLQQLQGDSIELYWNVVDREAIEKCIKFFELLK